MFLPFNTTVRVEARGGNTRETALRMTVSQVFNACEMALRV